MYGQLINKKKRHDKAICSYPDLCKCPRGEFRHAEYEFAVKKYQILQSQYQSGKTKTLNFNKLSRNVFLHNSSPGSPLSTRSDGNRSYKSPGAV